MKVMLFALVLLSIQHHEVQAARPTVRSVHPGEPTSMVWRNVLPEALMQALEKDLMGVIEYTKILPSLKSGKKQTFWLPSDQVPRTAIEVAVDRLAKFVGVGPNNAGGEWWVQHIEGGQKGKLGFHVDKDEGIASNQMYLVHPEYSSVFYLSNSGGGTLVLDQWSPSGNGYEPEQAIEADIIYPERNKYLVFQGDKLHGVIPGQDEGTSRMTFLINFFDQKPDEPNCLTPDYKRLAQHGVNVMDSASLKDLTDNLRKQPVLRTVQAKLTDFNVFPGGSNRRQSKDYTVVLPGKSTEIVRVPNTRPSPGANLHLRYTPSATKYPDIQQRPQQQQQQEVVFSATDTESTPQQKLAAAKAKREANKQTKREAQKKQLAHISALNELRRPVDQKIRSSLERAFLKGSPQK